MLSDNEKQNLGDSVKFGGLASQVIDNPAYQAAITMIKATIFEDFQNSGPEDAEQREEAWRTMKNLNALEGLFNDFLADGCLAKEQLEKFGDKK